MDGQKVAYMAIEKRRYVVVLATKNMREICRFVEDSVTESSSGQFSVGKDLLAITLANGDIMVWKIDTHSRAALVRMPIDIKVTCLSVAIDESTIYFGSINSTLGVASVSTGQIFKRLWIGEKTMLDKMCIATSKGKERFFLASGPRLSTCDSKASLQLSGIKTDAKGDGSGMLSSKLQSINETTSIPLRHAAPISAVLPFRKKQKNGVEAISVSRDGRLVTWAMSSVYRKMAPTQEVFVADDLMSCRLNQTTGFAIVTAGTAAIIWNVSDKHEMLRITHKHALRDAILIQSRIEDTGLVLYTWAIDGQLYAWKIMGKVDLFLTYDTTPMFTRFITALPDKPHSPNRREMLVANDFTVMIIDARSGEELRRFETRGHETVLDLSWYIDQGEVSRVMYASKTTLFVDGQIWSYGGSLGDMIQLDTCKRDPKGNYVGYSGVQMSEPFIGKTNLGQPTIGIVVVIAASANQRRHRVCMLRHDNARVLQWSFLHDPSYVVTVATDMMVRVWDIRGPAETAARRIQRANQTPQTPSDGLFESSAMARSIDGGHGANDDSKRQRENLGQFGAGSGARYLDGHDARQKMAVVQQAQLIGAQIGGTVGHVRAMFPLRSPCTYLSVSEDDYVLYTGNEQGDVLQFKLEFGVCDLDKEGR
eukprot:jgi/Hompol1/560/HPOL_004165-RA